MRKLTKKRTLIFTAWASFVGCEKKKSAKSAPTDNLDFQLRMFNNQKRSIHHAIKF